MDYSNLLEGVDTLSDENAITEQLRALFVESFHIEVPSPDTDLLDAGILDSLQFVELLVQLEQRFGLRIKVEDIDLNALRDRPRSCTAKGRVSTAATLRIFTERDVAAVAALFPRAYPHYRWASQS